MEDREVTYLRCPELLICRRLLESASLKILRRATKSMRCLVGIDDTDSRFGQCTTQLGFRIVRALRKDGCLFEKYPRLVRLNPNIPFKTRGNAAVCIEFDCGDPDWAFKAATELMLRDADVRHGANPGLVFLKGRPPAEFRQLYLRAVSGLLNYRHVLRFLDQNRLKHSTSGNGMGVVGATASIGFRPSDDHTYELIAYRSSRMCGKPRVVNPESVKRMERVTFPHTFNSFDYFTGRVLITPHGPDPVFLGIRADSPDVALSAFRMVEYSERLVGHIIYLSNQCTDAHLAGRIRLPPRAYDCGWEEGVVGSVVSGQGGHLFFDLSIESRDLSCAIYEPARDLRRMAAYLRRGDRVRVFGGVRRPSSKHGPTLNVEKLEVISIAPATRTVNPTCKLCGSRMKSEGNGKGFQCRRCGARSQIRSRSIDLMERRLTPGIYLPSAGSQRHLTKQLVRYGRERSGQEALVEGWLSESPHPIATSDEGTQSIRQV